jgi:hypothetical protein
MEAVKTISDQGREVRNEYQRQWRRRNPERMRSYRVNYWERKAEKQQNQDKQPAGK